MMDRNGSDTSGMAMDSKGRDVIGSDRTPSGRERVGTAWLGRYRMGSLWERRGAGWNGMESIGQEGIPHGMDSNGRHRKLRQWGGRKGTGLARKAADRIPTGRE